VSRTFLDTNVLVYSDDRADKRRSRTAIEVIEQALCAGEGVLSTQVLQEYYAVTTRKLGTDPDIARRKVALYARMDVVQVDVAMILEGTELQRAHQLSFWDALILAAASRGCCATLLTEDLQHGSTLAGMNVLNPFA
jgi:predicted nucleic acid-binding protein